MGELHQVSCIQNTRLAAGLFVSLPLALPGLEEAVRASGVYPQKVLVIYAFFYSFFESH